MNEKHCEGQVEFKATFGLDTINGYVKIPKQEYSISDDDFEIYIYTRNGAVQDCDVHEELNPYLEELIWGEHNFLEHICDNAHHHKLLQFDEITLCGEECDEVYLEIDGTDFEWDVKE